LDLALFAFIYRWALGWLEGVSAKSWTRADGWGGEKYLNPLLFVLRKSPRCVDRVRVAPTQTYSAGL